MAALTRQELKDLEAKEKTELEKAFDILIQCLPNVCGLLAILEYLLIPDNSTNRNPNTYLGFLVLLILVYDICGIAAAWKRRSGDKKCLSGSGTGHRSGRLYFFYLPDMII